MNVYPFDDFASILPSKTRGNSLPASTNFLKDTGHRKFRAHCDGGSHRENNRKNAPSVGQPRFHSETLGCKMSPQRPVWQCLMSVVYTGAQTRHVSIEIGNKKFEVEIICEVSGRTAYKNMQYSSLEEAQSALKHRSLYSVPLDIFFLDFNDTSPDASDTAQELPTVSLSPETRDH
jgi:hypothetical protein